MCRDGVWPGKPFMPEQLDNEAIFRIRVLLAGTGSSRHVKVPEQCISNLQVYNAWPLDSLRQQIGTLFMYVSISRARKS